MGSLFGTFGAISSICLKVALQRRIHIENRMALEDLEADDAFLSYKSYDLFGFRHDGGDDFLGALGAVS